MRRALAVVAVLGGLLALFADLRPQPHAAETITAPELAQWIHDRKPGLRVIDHRSRAAFEWYHVPGAVRDEAAASADIVIIADGRTLALRGGMQSWLDMLGSKTAMARYFGGPPRRGGC